MEQVRVEQTTLNQILCQKTPLRIIISLFLMFSTINMYGYGSAKVNKVWLEHNNIRNGEKGIMVHAELETSGLKGNKIEVIAYFHDENKNKLMGGVNGYKTREGQVCAWNSGNVTYDESKWPDFKIFIPYRALPLISGTHSYYVIVSVKDVTQNKIMITNWDYIAFIGTGSSLQNHNNAQRLNPSKGTNPSEKIWREDIGIHSFAINKETNGTRVRTTYTRCSLCQGTALCPNCAGTKRCALCYGRGFTYLGFGDCMPCVMCGQTGVCSTCNKTGKCACSSGSEYPGFIVSVTTVFNKDGVPINNISLFSPSSPSKESTSNSHNNSTTCKSCGGTGVSKSPVHGLASWAAYYNSSGTRCPHCGSYESHMHDRCASCNVPTH